MAGRTNGRSADGLTADVVVVGSGPGGAVTATLCAEAGKSVIMIEEGQNLRLESAPHFSREEILQKYRNAGINIALGKAKIAYVEARCVGGGSEINRGLYHRIPDGVIERWRTEYDVEDFAPGSLIEHFEACEKTARVEYLPGEAPLISTPPTSAGTRSKCRACTPMRRRARAARRGASNPCPRRSCRASSRRAAT
jgi:choline dehydrogenase-like flavoprotein